MADFYIEPSQLEGSLFVPSSKSHTLRAILFAALATGESQIAQYLPSPDTAAMIEAVRLLGARVTETSSLLHIEGFSGKPQVADNVIQCGNSGQVLRFIGALAGLIPHYTILTGDYSIRHNRPAQPLLDALNALGAIAISSRGDGHAPILVKGPFTNKMVSIEGEDSQPVSGLLIAGAFAPFPIECHVKNPGEKPWIDLTLDWFKRLGIRYECKEYTYYRMDGSSHINGFSYAVPGDFSTAAFPIGAALVTHSELTLQNIDMDDVQGDKALIPVLQHMGAHLVIDRKLRTLTVKKGQRLHGMKIDINDFIDALPILAVIGCFAEGKTEIVNASVARKKESDRISSIASELKKMGAHIEERADGLIVHASTLHGATVNAYDDHRLALSLSVAALAATGSSTICGVDCTAKTYPHFAHDFRKIGAKIWT
ncbi:MAG: 3-phosphoshikimate 1-carboxyvinyltransferase [Chlamydiia bacterium]|nr:3-phosphoshikimate 1-carboxyvinyltransferase [Chlamydiia bacterium]